jgi:hypothetical protein
MSETSTPRLPLGIKFIIALLITKAAFPILGEIVPHYLLAKPLPFTWGLLSFLAPAVLLPLLTAFTAVRSPAAGFWAALVYAGFAAGANILLIVAPKIVTESLGHPSPDPLAEARAFEEVWRSVSIGISLLLVAAVLRPSVMRWINTREEQLHMTQFPSRRTPTIAARGPWVLPIVVGAIVPTLIWLAAQRNVGNIQFGDAIMDILLEHLKGRALMLDLFTMLPYAVLAGTAYKNARRMSQVTLWAVTIGGIVGIVALMVPMYYIGWQTIYNDIRGDEKSTGAMIFFFTPLYCLATMLGGMLLGWVCARFVRKGVDDLIEDHT